MAFTQDNKEEEQQGQNAPLMTGGGQGSLNQGISNAPVANTTQQNRQGSGRFTNMNKYVQANQQGSANLANRIGSGIQNQLTGKQQDITQRVGTLGKQVETGSKTLEQGKGQTQELKNIGQQFKAGSNFSVLNQDRGQFSSAQNAINDFRDIYDLGFKDIQQGRGVDETTLQKAQEDAARNAGLYQDLFKQRQAQVGNTQGREQALQEFIGGANQAIRPTYSSGQRKLDQLVLGQNKSNLQNLINTVGANQANVNKSLEDVNLTGTNVSNLIKSEADLLTDIGSTTKDLQSSFQSAFNQPKIDELNKAREERFRTTSEALAKGEISRDLFNKLNDKNSIKDMTTFNLFANSDLGTQGRQQNDFFERLADAQQAQDIVNQQDVETDAFLAQLVGDPNTQKFKKAGNISTDVNWRAADPNDPTKSMFTQKLLEEQARQLDLAKATNLAGTNSSNQRFDGSNIANTDIFSNDQSIYDAFTGALSGSARLNDNQLNDINFNRGIRDNADKLNLGDLGRSGISRAGSTFNEFRSVIGNELARSGRISDYDKRQSDLAARQIQNSRYKQLSDYIKNQGYKNVLKVK